MIAAASVLILGCGNHAASATKLTVMMNGLPGAMGKEIAAACLRREGVGLAPFALTGPGCGGEVDVDDGSGGSPMTVKLYEPEQRDELAAAAKAAFPDLGSLVCVDFTHPSAVNGNAEWYAANQLPFVMGTTGGDRDALLACVDDAKTYAVIAPNMAKQIVALQAALQQMAEEFPGSFSGYSLSVVESHQSTKADTSGTAKAISASLAALTNEQDSFVEDDIVRVRDPPKQLEGGGMTHKGCSPVPEAAVNGHAFHTYSLTSGDGNVEFQIRHNVAGRSTYAEGTVDACVFLGSRASAGASQTRYDMIDVLKAGEM
jgi:4-hydroxy-tetrahydrodipicolinate reductase